MYGIISAVLALSPPDPAVVVLLLVYQMRRHCLMACREDGWLHGMVCLDLESDPVESTRAGRSSRLYDLGKLVFTSMWYENKGVSPSHRSYYGTYVSSDQLCLIFLKAGHRYKCLLYWPGEVKPHLAVFSIRTRPYLDLHML